MFGSEGGSANSLLPATGKVEHAAPAKWLSLLVRVSHEQYEVSNQSLTVVILNLVGAVTDAHNTDVPWDEYLCLCHFMSLDI